MPILIVSAIVIYASPSGQIVFDFFDYTTAAHKSAKQIAREIFLFEIIVICAFTSFLSRENINLL
jgi:hypothetical protein